MALIDGYISNYLQRIFDKHPSSVCPGATPMEVFSYGTLPITGIESTLSTLRNLRIVGSVQEL